MRGSPAGSIPLRSRLLISSALFIHPPARLAAAIFQTFVASDDASSTFGQLKRLHGLMPYFVLKGILRISNPMAMIRGTRLPVVLSTYPSHTSRPPADFPSAPPFFSFAAGVLELFLARPFGGQSLIQRFVFRWTRNSSHAPPQD